MKEKRKKLTKRALLKRLRELDWNDPEYGYATVVESLLSYLDDKTIDKVLAGGK